MFVWLILNDARLLRLPLDPSPEDHAASATPAPAFRDRVPRRLGRELVALSAELHYLRVHTDQGDALVLSTGLQLPVSRSYRTDVVAALR